MIRVHKSFFIVAILLIIMGHAPLLVILFISVTAHELAHILAAKHFGCKATGFHISALGEMAVLRGLDVLAAWKRYIVYTAGPFINFLIAGAAYLVGWHEISLYNFILGAFNLLPVFPLDGGRLLQLFLGNRMGILRANRFILKIGRALGLLMLIPGGVQVVLFPFNISLICAGIYIYQKNKKLSVPLTFEFFSFIANKKINRLLPIKAYAVSKDTTLQALVERMEWDSLLYVRVGRALLAEAEIVKRVFDERLYVTAGEAVYNSRKKRRRRRRCI
jgi:stage IV sporulation protein FB